MVLGTYLVRALQAVLTAYFQGRLNMLVPIILRRLAHFNFIGGMTSTRLARTMGDQSAIVSGKISQVE